MIVNDVIQQPFSAKLFLAGIIAKQFYILPSGLPQIGDILILLAFMTEIIRQGEVRVEYEEYSLRLFVILVIAVNGIHMLLHYSSGFILSSFYYVFNFVVVILFKQFMYIPGFINALNVILKIDLLIQLFIYQSGRGRWFAGIRYMGSFNDPNQYAFFIFGAMLLICLTENIKGTIYKTLVWYIVSFYLMYQASSTGMLLGFLIFLALFLMFSLKLNTGKTFRTVIVICILFILFGLINNGRIKLPQSIEDSFMAQRLSSKYEKFSSDSSIIADERQWNRVLDYPIYNIIGAGEGNFQRFGKNSEIHSSILGPLWYYGIVPFAIWISWMLRKIRNADRSVLCVYIALIVESITLINNRQPFYWMIFALADYTLLFSDADEEYDY